MKTIILECAKDEETGLLGLIIADVQRHAQMNTAQDALLIAHDLIEHQNGPERIGTIDDEFEALGAIWYVRGAHGELRRDGIGSRYSIEENIASDVVRMFRDWIYGTFASVNEIPRTRAVLADDAIDSILDYAARDYPGEIDDEDKRRARRDWPKFRRYARALMRIGYSKARRKWEHKSRYAANNQFWAIEEAVRPFAKHCEIEGMRYVLKYGNGEAYCEESFEE